MYNSHAVNTCAKVCQKRLKNTPKIYFFVPSCEFRKFFPRVHKPVHNELTGLFSHFHTPYYYD
ncbi:hypothetical protein ACFOPX_04815 [Helicobacter baculiformis]|uniref:Uncharacterized protein n=1 Tax=Helicobacter baculiformis TaxID=427351 RepID=A0ABV7ZHT3_9HELI